MVLCTSAYKKYQCEILNGKKQYCRYVKDFIYSHVLIASQKQSDWEIHSKNLLTIYELLDERQELVRKYFSENHFTIYDYEMMMCEFNYTESLTKEYPNILGYFSSTQIRFITDFVNDKKLLTKHVSYESMESFFNCTLETSLTPKNIGKFALFLDHLRTEGLLVYPWQQNIMKYKLLSSPVNGKILQNRNLSVRLSEYKNRNGSTDSYFAFIAKEVKKMNETERK